MDKPKYTPVFAIKYVTEDCPKCKALVMHIHPTDEVWGEEEFPNGEFFQDPTPQQKKEN